MSRPRDSHDLRLLDTTLLIEPPASSIHWIHDVFGNSIARVSFAQAGDKLVIESGFRAEHFPAPPQALELEPYAARLPFSYAADEALDLGHTKERHYPDPEHKIDAWAKALVERVPQANTLEALVAMTTSIKERFKYVTREEVGVQAPLQTLELGSGSCRDFAAFMMEAVRSLGLAARFVSGYLYDENLVGAGGRPRRRRCDPRVAAGVSAGRRLGRVRPDQRLDRRAQPHSGRGSPRCIAGSAAGGFVQGRGRRPGVDDSQRAGDYGVGAPLSGSTFTSTSS